ncbi:MAG: hypothetical protein KKF26_02480, partial [Chloroflexi bacterium]|nr:hypothetical protein [Chloroflexota bacterium]
MDLHSLLPLMEKMPAYNRLLDKINAARDNVSVAALDAARSYLIAAIYSMLELPIIVITAHPDKAKKLYDELLSWSPSPQVMYFPEPDALPYQRLASDAATEADRIHALYALVNNESSSTPPLIVTSAPALMYKTTPVADFMSTIHTIEPGMRVDPYKLLRRWESMGYRLESTAEVPGTMSHRGGIVDIYPTTSEMPVRLEFFGNTIDSIRLFEPVSQRSQSGVSAVTVTPATELLSLLLHRPKDLKTSLGSLDLSRCNPEAKAQFKQDLSMLQDRQRAPNMMFYAPL